MKATHLFGAVLLAVAAACSSAPNEKVVVIPGWGSSDPGPAAGSSSGSSGSVGGSSGSGSSSGATGDAGSVATGVPCNIATFLAAQCTSCHSDPPMASALAGLVTYADLMATSHEDATKNEAQLSLARIQSTSSPMPPGGVPAAADVTAFQAWVNAGAPQGAACGTSADAGAGSSGGSSSSGSSSGSSSSGGSGDAGAGSASGVPCDVATMLAANCTGCHSNPPMPSALAGLVTYSDLMATAHEDATKNEAQLSLSRMQNASSPMPPGSLLPAADVTILQNWINAGYPKGSCGTADGGAGDGAAPPPPPGVFANAPPYAAKTGPSTHNAGRDCMGCHANGGGDAPQFELGGTVYDASGNAVSGAEVRLVDANGTATSVYSGPSGTFYKSGSGFAGPAHIGIRNATSTQNMMTALQSTSQPPASTGGACSACHCTGAGCTMAPIHLP